MPLCSEAAARVRGAFAVKNSATTRRMCGWLDVKRHAQQCRSFCAVDSGKGVIQTSLRKGVRDAVQSSRLREGMMKVRLWLECRKNMRGKAVGQVLFG